MPFLDESDDSGGVAHNEFGENSVNIQKKKWKTNSENLWTSSQNIYRVIHESREDYEFFKEYVEEKLNIILKGSILQGI